MLGVRIEELRKKIFESAGFEFNPDSPKQLQDVLFNRLELTSVKKTKTGRQHGRGGFGKAGRQTCLSQN